MIILHIETSTNVCSVAVSENGKCLFSTMNSEGQNHAALLSLFIEEALNFITLDSKKLDAVAVSSGPGSYTGLRIGVSTAKGLCYGFGIPLIAISTLEVLATHATQLIGLVDNALLCPMIDARRMEVYAAFYNFKGDIVRDIAADVIDETSYAELLEKQPIYFFGNGSEKLKTTLTHPNVRFIDYLVPKAENMIALAENAYLENRFVDVAYFEPFYLKEFQTTVAKAK